MSVTTLTTPRLASPIPARRKFTIIPRLDENPKLVAQAQTVSGKVAVVAMAVCLLGWRTPRPIVFLVAVALVTFLPAYRRIVLAAAGLYWIVMSGLLKQDLVGEVAGRAGIRVPHPAVWIVSGLACVCLTLGLLWLAAPQARQRDCGTASSLVSGDFLLSGTECRRDYGCSGRRALG